MSERQSARFSQQRRRRRRLLLDDTPWPQHLSLGDKLQRLALLDPDKLKALEALVNDTLADAWPRV